MNAFPKNVANNIIQQELLKSKQQGFISDSQELATDFAICWKTMNTTYPKIHNFFIKNEKTT